MIEVGICGRGFWRGHGEWCSGDPDKVDEDHRNNVNDDSDAIRELFRRCT